MRIMQFDICGRDYFDFDEYFFKKVYSLSGFVVFVAKLNNSKVGNLLGIKLD